MLDEDKTNIEIESAINYLRLRKIKKMLLENQIDMEKPHADDEYKNLHAAHEELKKMDSFNGKMTWQAVFWVSRLFGVSFAAFSRIEQ